jgi:hypothetical protein
MLDPIDGLEFHEEIHRYRYQGQWMAHSVTAVVGGELDATARERIEATRHVWGPRGTAVHGCLEAHLLGQPVEPGEYDAWVEPMLDSWLFRDCEVVAVEYRLVDPRRSLAGSFDFLLRTASGSLVLGDLKTVGSANAVASRKPASEQLGGYLLMLADHHPWLTVDKCVTAVSGPGTFDLKVSEPQACADAWLEAWDRHQAEWQLRYGF